MRIISGRLKGILIQPPKGLPVRPTTDRAKESLFNILGNHFTFDHVNALDLFSGTGNIAFEFWSRGTKNITAIDSDEKCIRFIREMQMKYNMSGLNVVKKDVFSFLRANSTTRESSMYDIIFADAPYALMNMYEIPKLVSEGAWLNANGWLIVEHESHLDLSHESTYFDKRVYGQSAFSFFHSGTPGEMIN